MRWSALFSVLFALLCPCSSEEEDPLLVRTRKGYVQGFSEMSVTGKMVDMFYGIPYAQPPIGKNRFKHPRPIDSWDDTFQANRKPNSCMQIRDTMFPNFRGSEIWNPNTNLDEDCLKVNVWVPQPRTKDLPVMVWIFGGGFFSGTSTLDLYDAKILSGDHNVIVVSLNYRVASLGFLYFGIPEAPGNAGLFDQLMALEWVRDNIAAFGGNPKNVTLFGESAGAASIALHLLSPLSRNLFSQAILQSGSATASWVTSTRQQSITRGLRLAEAVHCPNDPEDLEAVVACLLEKEPTDLVNSEWNNQGVVDFPFVPVVDGSFLIESTVDSMHNKYFKKTRLLLGSDREEGSYFLIYFLSNLLFNNDSLTITRQNYTDTLPRLFPQLGPQELKAVDYEYTDWVDPENTSSNLNSLDKMVGDKHFTCGVVHLAQTYAKLGLDVFMYTFQHRYSINPWPKWMGVLHGDEIAFIFGEPMILKGYTESEIQLSKRMMGYWTEFAKTGRPSPDLNHWPKYTPNGREYITLATNTTAWARGHRTKQCEFWNTYLPELSRTLKGNPHGCTAGGPPGTFPGQIVLLPIFLALVYRL